MAARHDITAPDRVPAHDYITSKGAAEMLGLHHSTVRAAVRRGELAEHPTHDGKVRLLVVADVRRWGDAERRPGPRPDPQADPPVDPQPLPD